jgi:ABC-type glycerol-3-phosphate transport system substrate-binding protein
MRFFFLLFAALVFTCHPQAQKQPIKFIHYFTGSLSSGIKEMAEVINQEQDDFFFYPTPMEHEAFKSSIRLQLDGPNPPDLFSYWAGARTQHLVDLGNIQSLENFLDQKTLESAFDEAALEIMSHGGKSYMLPLTRHYVGFFYNKGIFESYGLEVPDTYEKLLFIAERLKNSGLTPFSLGAETQWPAQFWFDYLILRTHGFSFRQDLMQGKVSYDSPEVRLVMEEWRRLINLGYFNRKPEQLNWETAATDIFNGKAAMTLVGTWAIGHYQKIEWIEEEDYGFFPFPSIAPEYSRIALGPVDGVLVARTKSPPPGIKNILLRLLQEEAQTAFNLAAGSISPRRAVHVDKYSPIQQEIIRIIQESDHWAFNFDLATPPAKAKIGLDNLILFLENPDTYLQLLEEWQKSVEQL